MRVRRDFRAVLSLIKTHAILHQESRGRGVQNRIVADRCDYNTVKDLMSDILAQGLALNVRPVVRETVEAVRQLTTRFGTATSVKSLAMELALDASAVRRRVYAALEASYLTNAAPAGKPLEIGLGETMPDERQLLPHADAIGAACTCARESEGSDPPPSSEIVEEVF